MDLSGPDLLSFSYSKSRTLHYPMGCEVPSQSAWLVDGLREPWVHLPSIGRSPKGGRGRRNYLKILRRCGDTGLSKDRTPTGLSAVPAALWLKVKRVQ